MGLNIIEETMMKSLLLIALVAALAQASMPEETFVQEGSEMESFAMATDRVESQLEEDTQARRSACVKAADASINNVFTDVKNSQRMLNRLDNGRNCATRNQHLINRAQHTIRLRQRQLNTANANLRKARRARVRWNFSYESLREGSCSVFFRSGAWQAAKRVVNHRNRVLTQAKANLQAAKNNLTVQVKNAKIARNKCRCAVKKNVKKQLAQARKLTGDRQKTILREMMVKCLVASRKKGKGANAAAAKCKSLRISAAYSRRLVLRQTKLGAGVHWNGAFYRTLGGAALNGHHNGCDNKWRTIPKGCHVNQVKSVNSNMGKKYRWSTHVLCSQGFCHNTVGYSVPGREWGRGNRIRYSGHCSVAHQMQGRCRAHVSGCSLRILLKCPRRL